MGFQYRRHYCYKVSGFHKESFVEFDLHAQVLLLSQPVEKILKQLGHLSFLKNCQVPQILLRAKLGKGVKQKIVGVVHDILDWLLFDVVSVILELLDAACHHDNEQKN